VKRDLPRVAPWPPAEWYDDGTWEWGNEEQLVARRETVWRAGPAPPPPPSPTAQTWPAGPTEEPDYDDTAADDDEVDDEFDWEERSADSEEPPDEGPEETPAPPDANR
jgi:hypothetical protein